MEALLFFIAGAMTGAAANNHSHYEETSRSSRDVVEVPVYNNCDVWFQHDVERLSNMIITRNYRNEAEHLSGLNFFRNKYGNTSFNVCYDALVTAQTFVPVPAPRLPEPYIDAEGNFHGEHGSNTSYPIYEK